MHQTLITTRILLVLSAMFILPGWAALLIGDFWRRWEGLQRWIVAVGLSIAFYPVVFYTARAVLPFLTFGPYKTGALLTVMAAWIGWRMRGLWKSWLSFDALEWTALAVFGMTLFTRFWILRGHPYPAWSDSLHHALLTQLTATHGQLPATLNPYFPVPLGEYHLGLYALTATLQWLAQVPAHTALLWTAQALNGLCGLGVYLVLDRQSGRKGAVIGAVIVGLLSHQPALYVNWGRFTQISAQAILPIAWQVTREIIADPSPRSWPPRGWQALCAAMLTAAVALLHFRVGIFYLLLLGSGEIVDLWLAYRKRTTRHLLTQLLIVGIIALLLATPVLQAGRLMVEKATHAAPQTTVTSEDQAQITQNYFEFPWRTVPYLVAHPWLLYLTGLSLLLGLAALDSLAWLMLLWTAELIALGNLYRLGIPALQFITNLGAILIMLYLPLGIVIGAATERVTALTRRHRPRWNLAPPLAALALVSGFVGSHLRVMELEPYRYFVTPADIPAMQWIKDHTPPDARFAINTYFWLPQAPHGTDAGYWIPYFTGRSTTAGVMINHLGSREYVHRITRLSHAVEQLATQNTAAPLQELGVDYVYLGKMGNFAAPPLDAAQLQQNPALTLVYNADGVSIWQIKH